MSAFALAQLFLKAATALIGWLREREMMGEAEDAVVGRQLKTLLADIDKADQARAAVRDKLKSDPGWMPGDDPNRRD